MALDLILMDPWAAAAAAAAASARQINQIVAGYLSGGLYGEGLSCHSTSRRVEVSKLVAIIHLSAPGVACSSGSTDCKAVSRPNGSSLEV